MGAADSEDAPRVTADLHSIPTAPLVSERVYNQQILGRRVRHRYLGAYGRLTGTVRWERDALWVEAQTNDGTYWWPARNCEELGPIPMSPSAIRQK